MSFITLIIGFVLLIKGADVFVDSCSSIARKFNVPSMIIGLTIVAMGTSAPEAAVSITSSLAGQNDMSVANVVGSNFFNILVVLGCSAILAKLPVEKSTIKKDTPFLLIVSAMMLLFAWNLEITRIEGLLFLALFVYFLVDTIKTAKASNDQSSSLVGDDVAVAIEVEDTFNMTKTIVLGVVGIVGIVLGGDFVVDGATEIATSFGMSANLVGLTIVAMGTSLPEFVTSVMAIKKGETEIAIGNVIGSNLFNILLVLGLSATISPIMLSDFIAVLDVLFMFGATIVLYLFMKKDNSLVKAHGIVFLVSYFAYMAYTIIR